MTRTFVDASVLVAIVGLEDDVIKQGSRLRDAPSPITSAIGVWEAAVAIARLRGLTVADAKAQLDWTLNDRGVEIVPLGSDEAVAALDAQVRYGKRNHAAKLNMGDCFAYACAKTNNAGLLYKGDDFARTDLA
jgi:ribonuclease VapC